MQHHSPDALHSVPLRFRHPSSHPLTSGEQHKWNWG